jgi:hypothetical protein
MTGTDTSTAPTTGTSTPTGSGTISISRGAATDYVLVLAQGDSTPCVLTGAKVEGSAAGDRAERQPEVQLQLPAGLRHRDPHHRQLQRTYSGSRY